MFKYKYQNFCTYIFLKNKKLCEKYPPQYIYLRKYGGRGYKISILTI